MVNQIELVDVILRHLERSGIKNATPNQINSIIEGVDIIVEAMAQPFRPVRANMGVSEWIKCDGTGLSSKYMLHALQHNKVGPEFYYPLDPSDFGRCVGLLIAVPEFRTRIGVLANGHGREWAALANNWDHLEALYNEERQSGECPKLYAEMQRLCKE